MLKIVALAAASAALVGATTVLPAGEAEATSAKCAIIQSQTVGGYNWRSVPTGRSCSNSLSYGTSGTSYLAQKRMVVNYSERSTTTTAVAMATVHELSHGVEWRTTAAHRAKLYKYLGLNIPSGNYFAINDAKYYSSGSLSDWKKSPRERLAESVVNCTFGKPNHTGMTLVPRTQCKAFLTEFRGSLAASH